MNKNARRIQLIPDWVRNFHRPRRINFFMTVEDAYDALNGHQNQDQGGITLQTNAGRE